MKHLALLPALVACLLFALTLSACPPPPQVRTSDGSSVKVEPKLALAYSGAVSALVLLDDIHARHVASIDKATPEQFAKIKETTARLVRARDGLGLVRDWIEGKTADKQVALQEAFDGLKLVLAELEALGVKVPQDVAAGLVAVEAFLGK